MALINKIKEYWNNQPCNILHSRSKEGTKIWFNEIEQKRYFVEPHLLDFADFEKWKNKRVLEIGCGIGTDARNFVKNGANYTGLDISDNSINIAKRGFEIFDLSGEFIVCDATTLPYFNKKFDLIYSCGVLHHYPEPEKTINQIYNLLEDDGEFRFLVYAEKSWKYAMIQNHLDQYEAQRHCPYAKVYTEESIKQLLGNKFQIKKLEQDHCFMYNVPKYKQNIYELEPWFATMSNDMREAIKKNLGWHLLITATKI